MNLNDRVKNRHQFMVDKGYEAVMTALIGSQNYKLDDNQSDLDTITFVLPSLQDLYLARDPVGGEFELDDGKCMYKDIRLALNLLKKSSPNSVEYFISNYSYYNPKYYDILYSYLNTPDSLKYMIRCNYFHMLYAIAGMSSQFTRRHMLAGKRYSHALRLLNFFNVYFNSLEVEKLLEVAPSRLEEARMAKRDSRNDMIEYYSEQCDNIAKMFEEKKAQFVLTCAQQEVQEQGLALVEKFQKELILKYLEGLND